MWLKKVAGLRSKSGNEIDFLIVSFVFFIFILRNYFFSRLIWYPFGIDSFGHLYNVLLIKEKLAEIILLRNFFHEFIDFIWFLNNVIRRPPIYYVLVTILEKITGNLLLSMEFILPLLILAIILIFIYKSSEFLYKGSGLFSVLFFSIFPSTVNMSSGINMYWPLSAVLIAIFYYLVKSDFLRLWRGITIIMILSGVGLLTKEQFPAFFIGPFFFFLIAIVNSKNRIKFHRELLGGAIFFLFCFLVFTGFQLKGYVYHEPFKPTFENFFNEFFKYIKGFIFGMSPPLFLCLAISVFLGLRDKEKPAVLLVLSLFGAMLLFSLYKVMGAGFYWYYVAACFPPAAVVMGVSLKKRGKVILPLFFLGMIAFYYLYPHAILRDKDLVPPREKNTLQIVEFLKKSGLVANEARKISVFEEESTLLGFEIPVLMLLDGNKNYVGYFQFLIGRKCVSENKFDGFVYITDNFNQMLPSYEKFKTKLSESGNYTDVDRLETEARDLFGLLANKRLRAILPYFETLNSKLFYVFIYFD